MANNCRKADTCQISTYNVKDTFRLEHLKFKALSPKFFIS